MEWNGFVCFPFIIHCYVWGWFFFNERGKENIFSFSCDTMVVFFFSMNWEIFAIKDVGKPSKCGLKDGDRLFISGGQTKGKLTAIYWFQIFQQTYSASLAIEMCFERNSSMTLILKFWGPTLGYIARCFWCFWEITPSGRSSKTQAVPCNCKNPLYFFLTNSIMWSPQSGQSKNQNLEK